MLIALCIFQSMSFPTNDDVEDLVHWHMGLLKNHQQFVTCFLRVLSVHFYNDNFLHD